MISLQNYYVIEPPMIVEICDEELKNLIDAAGEITKTGQWSVKFPKFPCYIQAVKRTVKLVMVPL